MRSHWDVDGNAGTKELPFFFFVCFELLCYFEDLDLVLPSCDQLGWKRGHQEKPGDGLNEEKMGPRIRKKKRGGKKEHPIYIV